MPRDPDLVTMKRFIHRAEPSIYPRLLRAVAADQGLPTRLQEACRESGTSPSLQFWARHQADILTARQILEGAISPQEGKRAEELETLDGIRPFLHFLKEVGTALGAPVFKPRGEGVATVIELANLSEKHADLFQPAAKWIVTDGVFDGRGCTFEKPEWRLSSPSMRRVIFGRESEGEKPVRAIVAVYLVTVGPGWDLVSAGYSKSGDTYRALLSNALGAGAADTVAQDLQDYLSSRYEELGGTGGCMRISPGYRDWPLQDQRVIMSILEPEGDLGVWLSEACVLIPEKSTSGLIAPRSAGGTG